MALEIRWNGWDTPEKRDLGLFKGEFCSRRANGGSVAETTLNAPQTSFCGAFKVPELMF